ncbi:MAG TPA: hypothetical protein VKD22_06315, partial [Ramlibacter sp.]|nr:hypothetical protein [Ramlibacter sp.]
MATPYLPPAARRCAWPALAGTLVLCGTAQAQDRTANPHGPLPAGLDCSACHTPEGWRTAKEQLAFDHAKVSGFALTGMHATAKCTGCHLDLRFDTPHVTEGACASCHVDVHQGRIAGACARCHDTRSFHEVPAIALHARAGFALTGAHLDAPCESCHRNDRAGAFTAVPQECIACHREAYAAALMPNHMAAGFPTDCQECHATVTWQSGAAFDHASAANGFALVGAHATLACETCHVPPNMALRFTATSQDDCISCHRPQFSQAHGAGSGFPTTCADCHSVNSWSGASFDHTQFPLTRAHDVSCATCHTTQGDFTQFTCVVWHVAQLTSCARVSGN